MTQELRYAPRNMTDPTPSVLIVEDEVDLLRTLEYNFKNAGFAVSATTRGRDAIRRTGTAPTPWVPAWGGRGT